MSSSIPQGLFPVGEIPKVWLSLTFSSHISCSVSGNLNSTAEAKIYSRTWSSYGAIKHYIQSDFYKQKVHIIYSNWQKRGAKALHNMLNVA